ncbi:inhibitor of vertebrate lysozyme family protein [Ectopseudomonas khazarica]|uniref:inhibitor of vertebrate lysozyme family protein n=1 Tax=Ectopseudomonas khazarica TaxID=2502979 RepID=UPI00106E85F7|nr:inhibitor of vertebrate lysozyme family protein [Pseudomonas khazarica]
MQSIHAIAAALLMGGGLAAQAADRDASFHPGELLTSNAEYREAWQDLVRDEQRLPEWLMNLSGLSTPMQAMEAESDRFLVGQVCEAHNCFNQRVYVAFEWEDDDAYALYVQVPDGLPEDRAPSEHASLRWLGDPDEEVRELLEEQLRSDPNWY